MKFIAHNTIEELGTLRKKEVREHKKYKIHVVYLVSKGQSKETIADCLDIHPETVKKIMAGYNKSGMNFINGLPGKGGDRWNKKIDRQAEKELFESLATTAIAGKHVTASEIEKQYKEKINPELGKGVIFGVLRRIERKKKVPRTYHEKKTKKN